MLFDQYAGHCIVSNFSTQFSLATVLQLLKEAGVDLPEDASASARGKPSLAALPDVEKSGPCQHASHI
jgi:hypothetical protein